MSGLELVLLVGALVAGGGVVIGGIAALVARGRQRRNRILPEVPTAAPSAWAGAHTPLARLHRRLQAAAQAAREVPDPDGALIGARVEVEQAALAVDDHLVALHHLAERERAARMAQATAAVASIEEAAARLADAASASRSTALPAVEQALERATLVAEARRELEDDDPTAVLGSATGVPRPGRERRDPADQADTLDRADRADRADPVDRGEEGEGPRPRPSTG